MAPSQSERPDAEPRANADVAGQSSAVEVETRAALAILLEPACEPASAAVHLEAAWSALVGDPEGDVPKAIRAAELTGLTDEERERLASEASALRGLARGQLVAHARRLAKLAADRDAHLRGPARRAERVRRWGGRAAAISGVLVVLAGLWIVTRGEERPPRWRGAYFTKPDFTGTVVARDDSVLAFDWGSESPMPGIERDDFSIRWDSCLVLETARTVGWLLTSNDGSRLHVNGELVVDNWEHVGDAAKGADQSLEAGVHSLRVEYRELKGIARITLLASLDGTPPSEIAPSWLRYPTGDDAAPCRGVEP